MALGFLDRCVFTAASNGTGNFVVASAVTGYLTPAQASAVDATTYRYFAQSDDLSEWEVGFGAYTSGSVTLARTTIEFSSNSNNAVNFSAAPKVYMGGPLARDMTWRLIGSFDIDADGPVANVDFTIDIAAYSHFKLVIRGLEVDLPTADTDDYIRAAIDLRDGGGSVFSAGFEEATAIYGADYDGNFVGTRADPSISELTINTFGYANFGNCIAIGITDNTADDFGSTASINSAGAFDSPPRTPTTFRLRAVYFDDSAVGYGAQPNLIGGTVELWGFASL